MLKKTSWFRKYLSVFCPSCGWEIFNEEGCSNCGFKQERKVNEDSLGNKIFNKWKIWMYPFKNIKHDGNEWYIDWFEDPGSISDIEQINIGDNIADLALNMTPYWKVSYVDSDSGKIFVTPIEPNPFLTNIGAGGAVLTEHDFDVHSGKHEKDRIDQLLNVINNKQYTEPSDVQYILLGTVPVNFGPNGAQGGWYNVNDLRSNRGGQQGMDAKEIMLHDVGILKKLNFSVPEKAADGTLDPEMFSAWVYNGKSLKDGYQITGEDWQNYDKIINLILNHPQPDVKYRNMIALENLPNVSEDNIRKVYKNISKLEHPNKNNLSKDYDPYYYMKEHIILTSSRKGWKDVLLNYEESIDPDNRSDVARSYGELELPNDLIKLEKNEEHPKVLSRIHYSLYKLKIHSNYLIDNNLQKYINIIKQKNNKDVFSYYAAELGRTSILANGILTSIGRYLEDKF